MSEEFDPNKAVAETASKLLADTLSQVVETGKGISNFAYGKVKLNNAFKNYISLVTERYSKAKSFLIRNQSTPLYEFYVPLGVSSGDTQYPKATISNLTFVNNFGVITGIAGSGKSMMIRHLFLDTLKKKEKIPVFIELRKLNAAKKSLFDLLVETLAENKFSLDEKFVKKALEKGRFAVLLDGFDEVSLDVRPKLVKDIHKFTKNYQDCIVMISSRPENEFSGWQDFTVWEIADLTLEQACELVNKPKIPFDLQLKQRFVKDLKDRLFEQHRSFLSNPLLLSIMLLTYEERADIPSKLSIFYQQAYEVLFQKHDALKPEFTRPRHTTLDIRDFEKVFSAFSVQAFDNQLQVEFSKTQALKFIGNCKKMQVINTDFNSEEYLTDAREAVCLLIDDGLSIKYTHRSFQEYFVARFIAEAKEEVQEKLIQRYKQRLQSDGVIPLLFEMNPDSVEKFLILPEITKLLKKLDVVDKVNFTHYPIFLREFFEAVSVSKKTGELQYWVLASEKKFGVYFPFKLLKIIFEGYHSLLTSEFHIKRDVSHKKIKIPLQKLSSPKQFDAMYLAPPHNRNVSIEELLAIPEVVETLINYPDLAGFLGLRAIHFIKNMLEEKHRQKDATLESILNL